MKNKKILVTGGAGFVGSSLVKKLLEKNLEVRVLDNYQRGNGFRLSDIRSKIDFIEGDIRDEKIVDKACKGINTVFHLAYLNGTEFFYTKPDIVLDIAVKGMTNIIDSSIKNNISEFFLASSSEVYQTPDHTPTTEEVSLIIPDILNPRYSYGGGKILCELMTVNYGKKFFEKSIIFRPHNVYGPNMGWEHVVPNFITKILNNSLNNDSSEIKLDIQGKGDETRAFIYIDDFIDGLLKVYDKGENLNIYNIGTTNEISIIDLANKIAKYFEKEIKIIPGKIQKGSTKR
ncbi:NAD-dependent epimerase/dehydratase family protein, partial [Candidatus Pelagibacter sp.]|nr:NAD-dependent epimerase/dehydratase family protein [Candidatus Pelagibacter sp.]